MINEPTSERGERARLFILLASPSIVARVASDVVVLVFVVASVATIGSLKAAQVFQFSDGVSPGKYSSLKVNNEGPGEMSPAPCN